MIGIENKVAVVTGGTRGLGKVMAAELARFGANVMIGARDAEIGGAALRDLHTITDRAAFEPIDVTRYEDVERLIARAVAEFGGVDFMVNNAGTFIGGTPTELSIEDWSRVIDVNLNGVFYGARAAARQMIEQGRGGRIVNVSSIIGVTGKLLSSAYAASKGGVNALTKNLAIDLADHGILVNAIVPGVCDTEINADIPKNERRKSEAKIPLHRWAQAKEIANGVVYLCSDLSTYVTGEILVVDGGYLAGKEVRTDDSVLSTSLIPSQSGDEGVT